VTTDESVGREAAPQQTSPLAAVPGASAELLAGLLTSIPDIVFFKDGSGAYLGCNPEFERFVGREAREIVGSTDRELFGEEVGRQFREEDRAMLALGGPRHNEEWITYPDGSEALVDTFKAPLRDSDGRLVGLLGVSRDITERKRAELELQQQSRLQELLVGLSSTYISLPLDAVEDVIRSSLRELGEFVGADRVYVFELDFVAGTASNTHEWCASGIEPQMEVLQDIPVDGFGDWLAVHRRGEKMVIPNVQALPPGEMRDVLEKQGIVSLLAVPMMVDGECAGFVGFDSVRCRHTYTESEQHLLSVFGSMLADVRRRQQAEAELRRTADSLAQRESYLTAIIENQPGLVWLKDTESRFLAVNRAFAASCGQGAPDNVTGKTDLDVWPEDLAKAYRADDARVIAGGRPIAVEEPIFDKGVKRWFETFKTPVSDATGEVIGTTGYSRDITGRKRAEEELLDVNRRLEQAVAKANRLQTEAERYSRGLEGVVREKVEELVDAQMATIFALARLAEHRDDDTGRHLERVGSACRLLGETLRRSDPATGALDAPYVENLHHAAPLHDIGKVGIPDAILLKPGRLSVEEFEEMKRHTVLGADTLKEVHAQYPGNAFLRMGIQIAESHHERWDGTGYPLGLAGRDIPLPARILAVADVYDAVRSVRSYKPARPHADAHAIILAGAGTQFDPWVVEAYKACEAEIEALWASLDAT
jgi:PAS domain S-box-containing protein